MAERGDLGNKDKSTIREMGIFYQFEANNIWEEARSGSSGVSLGIT